MSDTQYDVHIVIEKNEQGEDEARLIIPAEAIERLGWDEKAEREVELDGDEQRITLR